MKPSLSLVLFCVAVLFQAISYPVNRTAAQTPPAVNAANADQGTATPQSDRSITIPGPLRSFLRMAGLSQAVTAPEVLPVLAHTVVLQGYQLGRPTEFLILVRRYVRQAKELDSLAQNQTITIHGCKDSESLLRILGYRAQGECGHSDMTLVTADPERAFLTIDSGFPLLDLEDALQRDKPFSYDYQGTRAPAMFTAADWTGVIPTKDQEKRDLLESLLYEPQLARLYWAVSRIDPETAEVLKRNLGLAKLLPLAPVLDLYGSQLCVRNGSVILPGGAAAEKQWQDMVGASPKQAGEFAYQLLTRDHGWLSAYFDAMARTSQSQQEHFAAEQRFKRYYSAFRAPGTTPEAGARLPFRPAPALLVLVTRLQWDENGNPYVPGSLPAWNEILRQRGDSKLVRSWGKHSSNWRTPDDLAEAMFAFSREELGAGPLQAYLYMTELDHRRPAGRHLSYATVLLLSDKYAEFSDQFLVFAEFPDLSDAAIVHFLATAETLGKISDHTVRGNAMGIFQANLGIWQVLARQGEIDRVEINSSWLDAIKPFSDIATSAQLFSAGRTSLERIFQAATGKPHTEQTEMIDLLAGAHQATADGQQVHTEMVNRLQSVLNDQRLVSIDTLFTLDDGLKDLPQDANKKESLAVLAGELREFEMPQPIFTNSERTRWAAGAYNNRHTELQMHTDVAKTIRSSPSPKQLEAARGQLSTFLRDTLVGMNYAYYEPPGSQVLHNNPLFVRSHDFSGDTVMGIEKVWQAPRLFGAGSPAGGGAHLIGSLADLPYVLAETEQDFIAPDHVQALIWQQFVPGLMSNAIVPRWWNVSKNELHAVTLYQRAGEELLTACPKEAELRARVEGVLSERSFPEHEAWIEESLRAGKTNEVLQSLSPADTFYLTAEFLQKYPGQLEKFSAAGKELEELSQRDPEDSNWQRLSRDFGVVHPIFAQTYGREFINVRPFPALGGSYNRLMSECWDSGNLYWARLTDEMGYSPVLLNRFVPILTRRMVEKISASDIDDLPATVRALRETGDEFRQGKITVLTGVAQARN